jgi:predicted ArsR family transcriptional regulator
MQTFGPGLGETQRKLVEILKRRGPAALADLEASLHLARETLRDHLKSLAAQGLVERAGSRRDGPGRPQVLYRLSLAGEAIFPRREGEVLGELATFLIEAGQRELLEQFFAARADGKRERLLGRVAGLAGSERLAEVAQILSEEGFLAEIETTTQEQPVLRLCHCPLRHLVDVTHLPCRAELELVRELLGSDLERTAFMPHGDASCSYQLDTSRSAAKAER